MIKNLIITEKFTEEEIYNHIYTISKVINTRVVGIMIKHNKTLQKLKPNNYIHLQTSKITDSVSMIILAIKLEANNIALKPIFIVKKEGKLYAYDLKDRNFKMSNITILFTSYTPHFFSRYNERNNVNKTGIDLIIHFFIRNSCDYCTIGLLEYNNKLQQYLRYTDGLGIVSGEHLYDNYKYYTNKTFISNNMLKEDQKEVLQILNERHEIMKILDKDYI